MIWALSVWLGICRRFYGSDKGKFPANRWLGYALPMACGLFLAFPVHAWKLPYLLGLLVASWGGMTLADYADYWNLRNARDWLMMFLNGFAIFAPVGIGQGLVHGWLFGLVVVLSGLLMPVGYYLGRFLPRLPHLSGFTEWGEFLGHALSGLVMVIAWQMIK